MRVVLRALTLYLLLFGCNRVSMHVFARALTLYVMLCAYWRVFAHVLILFV